MGTDLLYIGPVFDIILVRVELLYVVYGQSYMKRTSAQNSSLDCMK